MSESPTTAGAVGDLAAQRFVQQSALVLLALGALVLAGWLFELELLKSVLPRAVTMKPNTAIAFVLFALALALRNREDLRAHTAGRGLAALIAAFGLLTLFQDLAGWDAAIDQAVLDDDDAARHTMNPGRMAPTTALAFALLGLGVTFASRSLLRTALSCATFLIGWVTLVGYLHDDSALLRPDPAASAMALHTAIGLLVAAGAVFCLAPRDGAIRFVLEEGFASRWFRQMLVVAFMLPLVASAFVQLGGGLGLWDAAGEPVAFALAMTIALVAACAVATVVIRRSESTRLEAVASLAESERRYRRTFDDASIGIAMLDANGRWLRANARLREILGYAEDELREMTYAETSPIEELEVDVRQWEMLRRGEISEYGTERRFLSKSGETVFGDVRLIREEEGDTHHLILVFQDITGRKLSEGTLRVYARALESIHTGVVICDAVHPDLPLLYTNAAFLAMTGYSSDEVIGRNCRFLNEKARDQAALETLRQALAKGEQCDVVLRNHKKDGTPFWNQLSIAPVFGDDGTLTNYIGLIVDATERFDAIVEREQLFERAESANRQKDRLVSVVSHDMRSPLNAIVAWLSVLEETSEDATVREAVEAIEQSVASQMRLIDDLLDASRMRKGQIEIDVVPMDLVEHVDRIATQLAPVAGDQELALCWERPTEALQVLADPDRVNQIVRNLVENAFKFTPAKGAVTLDVVGEDAFVRLDVMDTGAGIPRSELERVFEEFWQGERHASNGRSGLGLGLSIVQGLVERQDGSIEVDSAGLGLGTTFRVRLPRASRTGRAENTHAGRAGDTHAGRAGDTHAGRAGEGRPERAAAEGESPARVGDGGRTQDEAVHTHDEASVSNAARVDFGGARVVVVDDDEATVKAFATAFRRANAIVDVGRSAAEVTRLFEEHTPDLLVSDIGLPGRDGMELLQSLRALPGRKGQVPAIAVTGLVGAEARRRIHRAGFDCYTAKPVAPPRVIERAAQLLEYESEGAKWIHDLVVVGLVPSVSDQLIDALRAAGQSPRLVDPTRAQARLRERTQPDALFIAGAQPPGRALELANRLRAVHPPVILIAVCETDDDLDLSPFDRVLRTPIGAEALHRILRMSRGSK